MNTNFQLKELNSFSNCLKQIQSSINNSKNKKLIIEAVGPRKDMYQNILPLLFDIHVLSDQLNEYNIKNDTSISDCILLDGPGKQYTKSNYYIEYNHSSKEYSLNTFNQTMNILEPYTFFKENDLYFY